MRKAVKPIRDAFMEGAVEAGKKANAKTTTTEKTAAKEVKSQARSVDKNTSKRYNKNRTPYNSFATEAMKWAYSDRIDIGEQKFFNRKDKWVLLEKSNDGYVEMGSYTNAQRKAFIEEIERANEAIRNSITTTREGLREDFGTYASLTGSDLRYNGDAEWERTGNDGSNSIYQSESGSNGITDNQSSESGRRREVKHKIRTVDSNGNALTEAQSEYFKDSKVRDGDGNLLVVYHGTRKANFTEFKRNINFFTDSEEMADSYSPNGEKHVGYLNITKPFVIDAKGAKWSSIPIDNETKAMLDAYGSSSFKEGGKWRSTPADIASAIEEGVDEGEFDYDGIIIKKLDDTGSYAKSSKKIIANDYIAFSSSQFKNTTNTVPTNSKDIRYKSRSAVTSGQYEQMKANLSHEKVYTREESMRFLKTVDKKLTFTESEKVSFSIY